VSSKPLRVGAIGAGVLALFGAFALGSLTRVPLARADVGPAAQPDLSSARKVSDAFASVAERASQSVVSIHSEKIERFASAGRTYERPVRSGIGSGFVFDARGYILTNRHVVSGSNRIVASFRDGRRVPVRVVGTDSQTDVAVLKVDATNLTPIPFGSSERARVGEWVVAVGSPFGLDYTVTAGVLSAKGRYGIGMNSIEDYLQTDASINPGNSGGPLVNLDGEVIGINCMIYREGTGVGFAIPIELAADSAKQLIEKGRVQRAWMGVSLDDVAPEVAQRRGAPNGSRAVIAAIDPHGPAARGGLLPEDVMVSIDGHPTTDSHSVVRQILELRAGSKVPVVVTREGHNVTMPVVLGERPPMSR
jgi:serine protease Do